MGPRKQKLSELEVEFGIFSEMQNNSETSH